jgi:anti-sigma factor RsiW
MVHCPDTLAPTNEQLLSLVYAEGTLTVQEQAHFEMCTLCQQRLATWSGMQHALLSKLARRLCPGAGRLSYYCLDMLPAQERTRLASHLLDCPRCADEVAEIRRFQVTFEPFPAITSSLAETVRRLFATLVVQQARPVTRSDAPSQGWPRQYQAEALSLSLHLSRQAGGEIMLLGILTSADSRLAVDAFDGVTVDLYSAATLAQAAQQRPALSARVDDIGNLLLAPIPAGSYTLIVRLPGQEVVIEDLIVTHG